MERALQHIDLKQLRGSLSETVWLQTTCAQNGLYLTDEQLTTLERFGAQLLDWNKKINLVSRRDEGNLWTSHILHCLSVLLKVDIPTGAAVLDLGTGGGLPGIPLKIVRPDLTFTLLDSTQKKINVVKHVLGELGLTGIEAVWGRAEDLGRRKEHNHRYDIVVVRAVASLRELVRWSLPFLKNHWQTTTEVRVPTTDEGTRRIAGPTLIALKGGDVEGEIRQIRNLKHVKDTAVIDLTLKGSRQLNGGDKKIVLVEFIGDQK